MHEIDMSDPDLGYGDGGGGTLDLAAPDFSGMSATPADVSAVYEVLAELDGMSDAELDALLGGGPAPTQADIFEALHYEMGTRAALPSARTRREPLPHMSRRRLAQLGLIS